MIFLFTFHYINIRIKLKKLSCCQNTKENRRPSGYFTRVETQTIAEAMKWVILGPLFPFGDNNGLAVPVNDDAETQLTGKCLTEGIFFFNLSATPGYYLPVNSVS